MSTAGLLAVASDGTGSIVAEWGAAPLQFQLQGPVAHAVVDPETSSRVAFGGLENDVKVYDLERKEVLWSAKNVRERPGRIDFPCEVHHLLFNFWLYKYIIYIIHLYIYISYMSYMFHIRFIFFIISPCCSKHFRDSLCLRVPVKVTTLGWATKMCPKRSLITRPPQDEAYSKGV